MARILIVDDDLDVRTLGRKILATAGHDVSLASSATEAMDHLNKQVFELLITDAMMPQHSGFDLIRTLRNHSRFSHLPIMVLSGRRDREAIEAAVQLGSADYIIKPLDPILFAGKVENILTRFNQTSKASGEILLATVPPKSRLLAESVLHLPLVVKSLSEWGLVLSSTFPIQEDLTVDLEVPLFKEINVRTPRLKVLSCLKVTNGYETRITFVGADDSTLQKIRSWIIQNTPRIAS
jgi:CheY-like chemotaxis protein